MSGVSRNTLYRDVLSGKIQCIKVNQKVNRFFKDEAIAYAKEKKERGRSEEWKKHMTAWKEQSAKKKSQND